jgi:heat shock protein HslJ
MGSDLKRANPVGMMQIAFACLLAGVIALPVDADAQARKKNKAHPKAPAVRVIPPPPAPARPAPAQVLGLSGTFAITQIGTRPVRDAELAATRMNFAPYNVVSVATACNEITGQITSNASASKIVGFDNLLATEMGCVPQKAQAEATIFRLLEQTANIARAGDRIILLSSVGATLAQFNAVNSSPSPQTNTRPQSEANAPQRGAPAPTQAYFGDYALSELSGLPVAVRQPETTRPRPVNAPSTRFLTNLPTLYLREGGAATGMSGCNQFSTRLIVDGDQISRFAPLTSTRKRCLDRSTQRSEREVQTALRDAARVEVSERHVTLLRANGTRLARFSNVVARGPSLFGTTWLLRSINGTSVPGVNPPSIQFDGNRASGFAGCNRFNMTHERQNGRSRFQSGAMTKMACVDRARNDLEQRFMANLTTITRLDVTATSLTMRSEDGRTIMVLEAQ